MDYRKNIIRPDSYSHVPFELLKGRGVDLYKCLIDATSMFVVLKPFLANTLGKGMFVVRKNKRTIQEVFEVAGMTPDQAYILDFEAFLKPILTKDILFAHQRDDFFFQEVNREATFNYFLSQYLYPVKEDIDFMKRMLPYFPDIEGYLIHPLGCVRYYPREKLDFCLPSIPTEEKLSFMASVAEFLNITGNI